MDYLSDLLLAAGAFSAAVYCLVLSRRLKGLTALDSTMGTAIAILSAQVDGLNAALKEARTTAQTSSSRLQAQTERADAAARRLELLMASLHDLPDSKPAATPAPAEDQDDDAPKPRARTGRGARILRRRVTERAA